MPIHARVESLRTKHAELEEKLHLEETRPLPDADMIAALKREKLTLKDEIMTLESEVR